MNTGKPSRVHFHFADKRTSLPPSSQLKSFLVELFRLEKTPLNNLRYIFCSDNYLLEINRQYLNHDYLTDIISFPLSGEGQPVEGEIYISTDRVKDNAVQFKVPFREELLRVIFHGALHLCGYKDKTKSDIATMRSKEEHYLKQWNQNVPRGTQP